MASGFITKERNENGQFEVAFYTDDYVKFKKVEKMCIELIGHDKSDVEDK